MTTYADMDGVKGCGDSCASGDGGRLVGTFDAKVRSAFDEAWWAREYGGRFVRSFVCSGREYYLFSRYGFGETLVGSGRR